MYDKLLDRVCYISRPTQKRVDLTGTEIEVKPTFPYNPESKTAPSTALYWASQREYDHANRCYIEKPAPVAIERHNGSFKVRILNLEVRTEGGRAYKVVDDDGHLFDLREDQLLEALRYHGIEPGGEIKGDFVWGISGSQVKMVLVGGKLHKEMTERLEEVKTQVAISLKSLKPGNVYVKGNKSLEMYVGRVAHPDLDGTYHAFVSVDIKRDPWIHDYVDNKQVLIPWPEGSTLYEATVAYRKHLKKRHPESSYYDSYSLFLQKSPKFYSEIVENNDVTSIKDDVLNCRIENGAGQSLAELVHVKKHGEREKLWYGYHSYRNSYATDREKRDAEIAQTALEFAKQLVWK